MSQYWWNLEGMILLMLIFLQMKIALPWHTMLTSALPALFVRESLQETTRKHAATRARRTETGQSDFWFIIAFSLFARLHSFYLTVVAYPIYNDGILHFFGNVLTAELHAECTGPGCQTGWIKKIYLIWYFPVVAIVNNVLEIHSAVYGCAWIIECRLNT